MKDPRPLTPPIIRAANFVFESCDQLAAVSDGAFRDHFYARLGNPGVAILEGRLAELEGAAEALVFSSGMAAVATTILGLVEAGQRVAVDRRVYGGSASFFKTLAPRFSIGVDWFDRDPAAAITADTRLVFFESPTNPLLEIVDIAALAATAHSHGALAVIDGTLATPLSQRPLELGVDLVIHSATKALNGHHDVLAGAIAGPAELIEPLRAARALLGGILDPQAAFLIARGLETFSLRAARAQDSALALARGLEGQPGLLRVLYPGLESHPDHALARRQMRRFGSLVTLDIAGGLERLRRVVDRFEVIKNAASFGGNESLVSIPPLTSHIGWSDEELAASGLSAGIARISVGLEEPERLIADIAGALRATEGPG